MASNRRKSKLQTISKCQECLMLAFSFAPNAGADPLAANNLGFVQSVTRAAQGKFLATIPSSLAVGYPRIIGAQAELQFNGAGTLDARIGQITAAAGTVEIYLVDNTNAAQDAAAAATTRVNVFVFVENQKVS